MSKLISYYTHPHTHTHTHNLWPPDNHLLHEQGNEGQQRYRVWETSLLETFLCALALITKATKTYYVPCSDQSIKSIYKYSSKRQNKHQVKPNLRLKLKTVRNTNPIFIQKFDMLFIRFLHLDILKTLYQNIMHLDYLMCPPPIKLYVQSTSLIVAVASGQLWAIETQFPSSCYWEPSGRRDRPQQSHHKNIYTFFSIKNARVLYYPFGLRMSTDALFEIMSLSFSSLISQ